MEESQSVHHLMRWCSGTVGTTIGLEIEHLGTTNLADPRPTSSVIVGDFDIIGFSGAGNESDASGLSILIEGCVDVGQLTGSC